VLVVVLPPGTVVEVPGRGGEVVVVVDVVLEPAGRVPVAEVGDVVVVVGGTVVVVVVVGGLVVVVVVVVVVVTAGTTATPVVPFVPRIGEAGGRR